MPTKNHKKPKKQRFPEISTTTEFPPIHPLAPTDTIETMESPLPPLVRQMTALLESSSNETLDSPNQEHMVTVTHRYKSHSMLTDDRSPCCPALLPNPNPTYRLQTARESPPASMKRK